MLRDLKNLSNNDLDAIALRHDGNGIGAWETKPRLVPISWGELDHLPKREPLIKDVIDVGAMSAIIGATGAYKTGTAIDLAGHIALGLPWRGQEVLQGIPLYLAVEGGRGIAERLEAWRKYHNVNADDCPFYVIPEPIDLAHGDADARLLIQRITELGQVDFIVADTVSRALAGGDENSPKDMGAFVRNCDLIRNETGAHICSLHHLGKDESRGARGHSLLKAALDTEITATKSGRVGSLEITKQRDGPEGAKWGFAIEVVELDGEKQSYVVVPSDAPPISKASRWRKGLAVFRDAVQAAVLSHGQDHRPAGDGPLVKAVHLDHVRAEYKRLYLHSGDGDRAAAERQAWGRALREARGSNLIGAERDMLWLV
jgi:hypothetical protein